jgi:hypothetical protein
MARCKRWKIGPNSANDFYRIDLEVERNLQTPLSPQEHRDAIVFHNWARNQEVKAWCFQYKLLQSVNFDGILFI